MKFLKNTIKSWESSSVIRFNKLSSFDFTFPSSSFSRLNNGDHYSVEFIHSFSKISLERLTSEIGKNWSKFQKFRWWNTSFCRGTRIFGWRRFEDSKQIFPSANFTLLNSVIFLMEKSFEVGFGQTSRKKFQSKYKIFLFAWLDDDSIFILKLKQYTKK